jgi:hypothetical protein
MVIFTLLSVLVSGTDLVVLSGVLVCWGFASTMKSVRKYVFVLGLLSYVRSGKLYESSACNRKVPLVFAL